MHWPQVFRTHQAILDESFALQPHFVEFVAEFRPRFRNSPVLVPAVQLRHLRELAGSKVPPAGQREPRIVRLAKAAVTFLNNLQERRELRLIEAKDAIALLENLAEEEELPRRFIVLQNNPNTFLRVEAFVREQPRRPSVLFAEFDSLHPEFRGPRQLASWYSELAPQPPRSLWGRLVDLIRKHQDPYAPFQSLPKKRTLIHAEPASRRGEVIELKLDSPLRGRSGQWKLGKKIDGGGQGGVFHIRPAGGTGPPDGKARVCKLYPTEFLTESQRKKLELMITRPFQAPAICWPEGILFDEKKQWRGFLMRAAREGATRLDNHLFTGDRFVASEGGRTWRRGHTVQLAITILSTLSQLHDRNVLVGDFNPANILVTDERTIAWVDCDSFQVEGFPCPVGSESYDHPELLKDQQPYRKFLRTLEHELFAVATLLFQLFMLGGLPYDRRNGGTARENTLAGTFPYSIDDDAIKPDIVPGLWRARCWSHLSEGLKRLFLACFDGRPPRAPTLATWLEALGEYRDWLDDPACTFVGPPTGFDLNILPRDRYHSPECNEPGESP